MAITVEAVYENGVLKPTQPLPLLEHERGQFTIEPKRGLAEQCYGMMGWTGDDATLERIALDPDLDPQEGARPLPTSPPERLSFWTRREVPGDTA